MPALEQNRTYRDTAMATDKVLGLTYRELSKKYKLSTTAVFHALKKDEYKTMIEGGTAEMLTLIPDAIDVQSLSMAARDEEGNPTALSMKASENVLKMGSIIPSNVTNQTINNIYNQQNNIVTPDTMSLVKKIMPGFKDITTGEQDE